MLVNDEGRILLDDVHIASHWYDGVVKATCWSKMGDADRLLEYFV